MMGQKIPDDTSIRFFKTADYFCALIALFCLPLQILKRVKVILKFIGNNFDFIHFFQERLVAALKIDRLEVLFPEVLKLNNFFGSPLIFITQSLKSIYFQKKTLTLRSCVFAVSTPFLSNSEVI